MYYETCHYCVEFYCIVIIYKNEFQGTGDDSALGDSEKYCTYYGSHSYSLRIDINYETPLCRLTRIRNFRISSY
uniref:Uncharacterized protein n=1 Tax=Pararge aegeria TaxID=116150 RepID=S4P9W7_9NEOP